MNKMATKSYTSIQKMKQFAMEELAPKYFNMDQVNDLNIGLLGFTTEYLGTIAEDSFNTVLMYMNEMFPHLAIMPETIYNNATLFGIDGAFATPSVTTIYLFIPENSVKQFGVENNGIYDFYLDSNMIINVENIHFMLDYDIKISYKNHKFNNNDDYIFTAKYVKEKHGSSYRNSISNIEDPYIRLKRIYFENTRYLQIEVQAHQVNKFTLTETVVNNDTINAPSFNIEFEGDLANFEVFYKSPSSNTYEQLEKKLSGSSPSSTSKFCYYKMVDEGELELTFTTRDGYFTPEYNSELLIEYYTTSGEEGNFDAYTGNTITVTASSDTYLYNNTLTIFAIPITGAYNGKKPLTVTELKNMTVERFSTVGSYNSENDLQLYFNNFNNNFDSNILFLKTRDDIFERMFSAFTLLKDANDTILSTNTLDIVSLKPGSNTDTINPGDFDIETSQTDIYILKPGHVFTYDNNSSSSVVINNGVLSDPNNTLPTDDFVYTNPFLIYFSKSPTTIGYYLNSVNKQHTLFYEKANERSFIQFICKNLSIKRNAILGENKYHITIVVTPTTALTYPMVVENLDGTKKITNSIRVRIRFTNDNGAELQVYKDMTLTNYDLNLNVYTFEADIETDDYINGSSCRLINLNKDDGTPDSVGTLVPMTGANLHIYTEYKDGQTLNYETTNMYSTKTDPISFIEPIDMINSIGEYVDVSNGDYLINIKSVPLVKAAHMIDKNISMEFYKMIENQYFYLSNISQQITNNFSVDIKFYNTYGKSKNFYVERNNINGNTDLMNINRVNISIKFKVNLAFGVVEEDIKRDIQIFIKEYIETINENGTNSIYISNLITELENNFSDINYLKFIGINDYDSLVQSIENMTTDLSELSKSQRLSYVPEYLTLSLDDINIELI